MTTPQTIRTARLLLRPLEEADRAGFRAMHMDARMSRWLGHSFDTARADALFDRLRKASEARPEAPGPAAVTLAEGGGLLGLAGLAPIPEGFPAHAPGAMEILWRLAPEAWGRGYATEAAKAWIDRALGILRVREVRAWTAASNFRSRRVMRRLGMTRTAKLDFAHPALGADHPLSTHVVFCMQRHSWHEGAS